nr:hypothetical protein [Nitrosomonas nitrosa]
MAVASSSLAGRLHEYASGRSLPPNPNLSMAHSAARLAPYYLLMRPASPEVRIHNPLEPPPG